MTVSEHARLRDFVVRMNDGGISTIVSRLPRKKPSIETWKQFMSRRPKSDEIEQICQAGNAPFVICGAVSGSVICFDFEARDVFDKWREIVNEKVPRVLNDAYIERSPKGVHAFFRCDFPVPAGKPLAKQDNERKDLLIEFRGEGQGAVVAPGEGYSVMQGSLLALPVISQTTCDIFFDVARSFDELGDHTKDEPSLPPAQTQLQPYVPNGTIAPWDDYNQRGDVIELLRRHGAEVIGQSGENKLIRRPGKQDRANSATFDGVHFYNFSTNWPPFQANKGYNRFQVYALLEHRGDAEKAAGELRRNGFGGAFPLDSGVDLSHLLTSLEQKTERKAVIEFAVQCSEPAIPVGPEEPGPFVEDWLKVPGFIEQVIEHNLETAKKPQPLLALASAITLQAALAGRKVKDQLGNRTNLYIMAVAESGEGKDHGRALNENILEAVGLGDMLGGSKIASDAGLLTAVAAARSVLFQIDEFGRTLASIGDPKKAPHLHNIPTTLMELYSACGGIFRGKSYAANAKPVTIHQPCVNLIGYTTATWFYSSFTPEMLQDGFVGRLLVFESKKRVPLDIDMESVDPPASIVEQARWWAAFNAPGNLQNERPNPVLVPRDDGARAYFREMALQCDAAKDHRSLWSRVVEKACRLAMIYALSRDPRTPIIDEDAARWGCELSHYLTERLIYDARLHIAESDYERRKNKILIAIRSMGGPISASQLTSKTRWATTKERHDILADLAEAGEIQIHKEKTGGHPKETYLPRG